MLYFDLFNLLSVIKIIIILFLSAFAFFLPLSVIISNYRIALKYTIPTSIAIQIIFGYIYYIARIIDLYPLCYIIMVIFFNILAIYKLKLFQNFPKIKFTKGTLINVILGILLILPVVYTRFYDTSTNIAPGTIDTFAHYKYLFDLKTTGVLSYSLYPAGFHIFIYPLTLFIPLSEIYRFTGSILGLLVALSMYLLYQNSFNNKLSKYLLVLLFTIPFFNQLVLQTIGFFPTILTFIFFPFLIYFISQPKDLTKHLLLSLYLIVIIALSLTVPYFYIQYLPALFIILIVAFIFKKSFTKLFLFYFSRLLAITFLGIIIALINFYLQAELFKQDTGFPLMPTRSNETITISDYKINNEKLVFFFNKIHLYNLTQNDFVVDYMSPVLTVGKSVLVLKNSNFLNSFLSIGGYSWLLLSVFLCSIAIKQKNTILLTIIVFSAVFSIIFATGIFEMANYSGRSGWYFSFLALFGTVFLVDILYKDNYHKQFLVFLSIIYICSFLFPPVFYRAYFKETFIIGNKIKRQFPNKNISFITNQYGLIMLSDDFTVQPITASSIDNSCQSDACFLIIEKRSFNSDIILSQEIALTDNNALENFCKQREMVNTTTKELSTSVITSLQLSCYSKYWENENITVYKYNK